MEVGAGIWWIFFPQAKPKIKNELLAVEAPLSKPPILPNQRRWAMECVHHAPFLDPSLIKVRPAACDPFEIPLVSPCKGDGLGGELRSLRVCVS